MKKSKLAEELRERMASLSKKQKDGLKSFLDRIPDDMVIDSYITCRCCKEKQLTGKDLKMAIKEAKTPEDFINICDKNGTLHGHANFFKIQYRIRN